ncbi:tetratricopeptide repeat protein [Micromonospora sp. Llam0]|uniref:tetratricopeptide repeat protein n=1 Tax=Micromonospora sp. Llam0 TaxID=2485143 RepID=UPI0013158E5F|nr:tetratricopeptide repeat protein [Micromonospora sp. Llam0]
MFGLAALTLTVALGTRFGWWRAFGDPQKGAWPWIEAASWIVASASGLAGIGVGVASLVVALRSTRNQADRPTAAPQPRADRTAAVPQPRRDPLLLDRDSEYERLRERLTEGPWGVVAVTGPPGIGKTRLVDAVLDDVMHADRTVQVYKHEAEPYGRLDALTLIADIEGRHGRPAVLRPGEPLLGRLEAALEGTEQSHIIIVVDSAQHLVVPGERRFVDLQLDEALDAFATNHRHRVAVVLLSRDPLEAGAGGVWSTADPPIALGRLPKQDFTSLLRAALGKRGQLGPTDLSSADLTMLYRKLHGNPRCAQLMQAIVMHSEPAVGMASLRASVAQMESSDVPRRLADLLFQHLPDPRRRVIEALAAFATPVDAAAVAAALANTPNRRDVEAILEVLAKSEFVTATHGGRYHLEMTDVDALLPRDAGERRALLRRAADVLGRQRVTEPSSIDDLNIHFAQLRVLLRSHRYPVAHEVIELTADILNRWDCGTLLLDQRVKVCGKLGDPTLEMANDNVLGDLYGRRGDFGRANQAYGRALDRANEIGTPEIRTRIRANLGAMYWQNNDADNAYNYYEQARSEAEAQGALVVLMGTLEGLANCHRRSGQYDQAFRRAEEALAIAARPDFVDAPGAADDGYARTVRIVLRLARWHTEMKNTDRAEKYIEDAQLMAASRLDDWQMPACQDAHADLLLAKGSLSKAIEMATDAVEQAVRVHDPVTILQARTTLAMAYLTKDEIPAARKHIEKAGRYRRAGKALIVLALQALTTRQSHHPAARQLFDDLAEQARKRIDRNAKDFGAHHMLGFAICGQRLDTTESLRPARDEFTVANDLTKAAAPYLRERMRMLVNRLDSCAQRPGRLRPVLDALADTGSRPAG